MSKYADVYLCPVPEENIPDYKKLATAAGKLFLKHGALRYREYVASDLNVEDVVPFPKRIKLKPGETLVYAAVEFKSEAQRNKAMKAIMRDPELAKMMEGKKPPFDYKRMVYGGFKILVDL
jgi:alkaline phosphatase